MKHTTLVGAGVLGLGLSIAFFTPGFAQNNDTTPAPSGASSSSSATPAPTDPPRRIRLNPNGPGGGGRGGQFIDSLNLTADQRTKYDAETKDFQDKMQALQDDHNRKVLAMLTPEQADKYRTMQQDRRAAGGFGGGNGPGGPGGGGFRRQDPQQMLQMMKTTLNLNSDQETKISAILQDSQTKMQALRDSANGPNADRQAMRTQMQAIRTDQMSKINALLNDDQKAKWQTAMESMRGQRGNRGGGGLGGGGGADNVR